MLVSLILNTTPYIRKKNGRIITDILVCFCKMCVDFSKFATDFPFTPYKYYSREIKDLQRWLGIDLETFFAII